MEKIKNNEIIKIYFGKYNEKSFEKFNYMNKLIKIYRSFSDVLRPIWFKEYDLFSLAIKYKLILPDEGNIDKIRLQKFKDYTSWGIKDTTITQIFNIKNILFYKLINKYSIDIWEFNHKYNFIKKSYNFFYEINTQSNNTISDSIILFFDKYNPTKYNLQINSINLDYLVLNNEIKNLSNNVIIKNKNILKQSKIINIQNINEYNLYLDNIDKIDFIFINLLPLATTLSPVILENIKFLYGLYTFVKIINKININGSMCIYLKNIIDKRQIKIIAFYCSFFEKYYIEYPKIYEFEYDCLYLILINKKNITFDTKYLLEIINNNISSLGINKQLFTSENEIECLKKKIIITTAQFYESYSEKLISKIKISDKNIKLINKKLKSELKILVKNRFHDIFKRINYAKELIERKNNGTLTENEINEIKLKNIELCKDWARKYNMPLVPEYNISHFDLSYENIIYREIVSYENDVIFRFRPYEKINFEFKFISKEDFRTLPISFEKMIGKSKEDKRAFDYRDIDTYKKVKFQIDYYYKKLTYVIALMYPLPNDFVNNDEWLKITEILNKINLIDKIKTNIKSFHICEYIGSYVNAIYFFLNIKRKNIIWSWKGQRLNAKNKKIYDDIMVTNNLDKINDYEINLGYDENMLNTYKNNYDYGIDNTGDITKYENIQYYRKNHTDYDLITAGCGTIDNDEKLRYKLSYSQYLMIFSCCKKGGNALLKKIFPIDNSQELSMLYLFYFLFENVIVYKPKINYHSQEYFLIGINYKGIEIKLLDRLIEFLKDYKTIGFLANIPINFLLQVDKAQNELIENMNKFIKKQIYFCDNFENITDKEWKIIKKSIKEKIKDWFNDLEL